MPTILGNALVSNTSLDQMQGSLIRDVWYGRRSLPETYWKWGLLGGLVSIAAVVPFAVLAAGMQSVVPIVLYLVLMIPYQIWMTVGLWRSASAHGGFWGAVVRILVVINVIVTPIRYAELFSGF